MLEPLTDLPIEEPLEPGLPVRPARDGSVQAQERRTPAAAAPGTAGEELIDPEMLLGMTPATVVEEPASGPTPPAHDAASDQNDAAAGTLATSSAPGATDLIDPDELLSEQLLTGDPIATPVRDKDSDGGARLSTPAELTLTDEPFEGATRSSATNLEAKPTGAAPATTSSDASAAIITTPGVEASGGVTKAASASEASAAIAKAAASEASAAMAKAAASEASAAIAKAPASDTAATAKAPASEPPAATANASAAETSPATTAAAAPTPATAASANAASTGSSAAVAPPSNSAPATQARTSQQKAPASKPAVKAATPAKTGKPATVTPIAPAARSGGTAKAADPALPLPAPTPVVAPVAVVGQTTTSPVPPPAPAAAPSSVPTLAAAATPVVAAASTVVPVPAAALAPTVAPASAAPATPAASATPVAPVPPAPVATPAMDRDFIARNQIVERYLSGRLPLKGATDFERFCRDNPEILDELGLPERVNAGLRLLEASGKPEPWQEAPTPFWAKLPVFLGAAAAVLVLGVALSIVASSSSAKSAKIEKLQRQVADQPLDAATSTREIRLLPTREGASNVPAVTVGGGEAQLVDFRIDETRSPYKEFTVTIDRVDQGRVGVFHNLSKDSNGHIRFSLNTSALGPGNYQFTIEGISWKGEVVPDSWVMIRVQH